MCKAYFEVAAAGEACNELAAAGCDKADDCNLAGRLPFCLGNDLHQTPGSGGTMSIPVNSFATLSLHYNSELTLEPSWLRTQAGSEPLLQGLLMAWQGMAADELANLEPLALQAKTDSSEPDLSAS